MESGKGGLVYPAPIKEVLAVFPNLNEPKKNKKQKTKLN
jgi:hypothetical protein